MANFVSDANKLLDMQNGSTTAANCPFVIVLSDGRFNKDNVRRFMREAKEKRYLYIFVILDKKKQQQSKTND
jgi:midasin (ATPase involved in ribosome maturation)